MVALSHVVTSDIANTSYRYQYVEVCVFGDASTNRIIRCALPDCESDTKPTEVIISWSAASCSEGWSSVGGGGGRDSELNSGYRTLTVALAGEKKCWLLVRNRKQTAVSGVKVQCFVDQAFGLNSPSEMTNDCRLAGPFQGDFFLSRSCCFFPFYVSFYCTTRHLKRV